MQSSQTASSLGNYLLNALPDDAYQRLEPDLELVNLSLNQIIYKAGTPITSVYFPKHALISIVSLLEDGSMLEIGMVGREGMAGSPVLLGGMPDTHVALVQIAGMGWRLPAAALQTEFDRGGVLQRLLLRYLQSSLTLVAQTAVCNRFHRTEERLARWLLMVSDCLESDEFLLTHEFIGQMIGVRRAGVTVAAGVLHDAGLLRYTRGHITIVNRQGLERYACECYGITRHEFARLLGSGARL